MKKSGSPARSNIAAFTGLVIFIGMLIYLTVVLGINDRLTNKLNEERLEAELLLSEKLSEQKKIARLTGELTDLERQSRNESEKRDHILKMLSETEAELERERRIKAYPLIERQAGKIRILASKIAEDSTKYIVQLNQMIGEINLLQSQLADKINEQQKYMTEVDRLKEIQIDEVAIESSKKNKRLTTRAAKTNHISIRIQVSALVEKIAVRIVDPLGVELPVNDETIVIRYGAAEAVPIPHTFMIRSEIQVQATEPRRTVEILYKPKFKLRTGSYKIFLSQGDQYLGNVRLRLE